jgi:hypothetical protein
MFLRLASAMHDCYYYFCARYYIAKRIANFDQVLHLSDLVTINCINYPEKKSAYFSRSRSNG